MINRLLGYKRVLVDEVPGPSRDAIDTPIEKDGKRYILIDTAGIRRKSRISLRLEQYSIMEAFRTTDRADVALLLLDSKEGVTEQDARIGGLIQERGRGCILLVNKWDLVEKDTGTARRYQDRINREMKTFDYVPVHFISALTGQRVSKIFSYIEAVRHEHRKRISTGDLNRWFRETIAAYPPPLCRNRPVKLLFITQTGIAPPAFVIFANDPKGVTEAYQRYLNHRLREKFGFAGNSSPPPLSAAAEGKIPFLDREP